MTPEMMNSDGLRIEVIRPAGSDGVADIGFRLARSYDFRALTITVNGIVQARRESTAFGVVPLHLLIGKRSVVQFNAVSHSGTEWVSSNELVVDVPRVSITGHSFADEPAGFTIRRPVPGKRGFASIGLHNPKTPENVGGVIRAAHAYGAASVAISGQRIDGRHIAASTNTTRAERHLPVYRGELRDLIPFGAVPVAVELVDGAVSLFDFQHPRRAFYIFGPEDSELGSSVRDWCEHTVYVPTTICMNLAATVNVVLYDRACKEAT